MEIDWNQVLPKIIHKVFNTSSAIIGYIDMMDRTQNLDKISKYRLEARKGVTEIEKVFFELGYFIKKRELEIDVYPFNPSETINQLVGGYNNISFESKHPSVIKTDIDVFKLIIDLILRIIENNLYPGKTAKLVLEKSVLHIDAHFIQDATWSNLEGRWGYEMELLNQINQKLNNHFEISETSIMLGLDSDE